MKLRGDLSFGQYASYRVAASPDGQHSSVQVGGKATLAGSVVHVGANGSYAPSTTYTILTADGGVQGRFGKVSSNLAFLNPTLAYDDHRVDLVIKTKEVPTDDGGTRPIEFADAGNTSNQRAVARALQSLPKDSPLYRRVMNLLNSAPAGAFDGLERRDPLDLRHHAAGRRQHLRAGAHDAPARQPERRHAARRAHRPARPGRRRRAAAGRRAASVGAGLRQLGHHARRRQRRQDHANRQRHHHRRRPCHRRRLAPGRRAGLHQQPQQHRRARRQRQGRQLQPDNLRRQGLRPRLGQAQLQPGHGLHLARHVDPPQHRRRRPAADAGSQLPWQHRPGSPSWATPSRSPARHAGALRRRRLQQPAHPRLHRVRRRRRLRGDSNRNNVATTTLGLHARSAFESAGARGQVHGTLGWRHAYGDVNPASTLSFVQGGGSFTANGVPVVATRPWSSWA